MTRPDVEVMRALERMFWLELREPRRLPDRKGPWPKTMLAKVLREFMAARPEAYITVVTVSEAGPRFEDGPEALEMTDVRSRATAARHRRTSHEARTALRTSGTGRSEAEDNDSFSRELQAAYARNDADGYARVLSGRLRQMDRRAKAANIRADQLEVKLRLMRVRAEAAEAERTMARAIKTPNTGGADV